MKRLLIPIMLTTLLAACSDYSEAWNDIASGRLDTKTEQAITKDIGKFLKDNYDGPIKYNSELEIEEEGDFCGILINRSLSGKENKEKFEASVLECLELEAISEYTVVFMEFGGKYDVTLVVNP